ncbi:MAG: gliding motility-associated C-terminal domain-containing protein, partial [Bacteroidales bacterium]
TATPTNGGTPTYQWKNKGTNISGATSPTYTSAALANGDIITVVMTSTATCATGSPATSNAISMTVNPLLPVSVTIAASSSGAICAGTSVTFTATPTNGGTSPVYQWRVNGSNAGTNSSTYTYVPVNSDIITCILTSSATPCATGSPATSNAISMTVNPLLPVSVSISAVPSGAICAGTSVTFTAKPVNGGATPVYQWKVNGSNVGINSSTYTYNPSNSDVITCVLTSNAICATGNPAISNAINMVVNANLPVSVLIGASANPVCAGTPVSFMATPANGGASPVYQWRVNGSNVGTNSSTYLYNPSNNDIVTCVLTSNATPCITGSPATSNAISMTVNPLPAITLTSSEPDNIFCEGTSVTFTAGGGTTYNFRVGGKIVQTGVSATYTSSSLTNGQVVSVSVTNSNGCTATSAGVTNFVNPLPFIIVTSNPVCSPDLLTYSLGVTVSSGIVTSTAGTVINTSGHIWSITGIRSGTNITLNVVDAKGCESILVVNAPDCSCPGISAPVSGGNKSYCEGGTIPTITAVVSTGETVDWYNALSGGTLLKSSSLSYTPTVAGTYYAMTRNITSGCVSSTRTPVKVTMNPLPIASLVSSDADNIFCAGTTVLFTAEGGTNYNFKIGTVSMQNSTSTVYTTKVLTNGQIVSVVVTNSDGCSATSAGITNTVLNVPVPNAGPGGNECDLNYQFKAVPSVGTGTWTQTSGPGSSVFSPDSHSPTATVTVTDYGSYTFAWTEANGECSNSTAITVNFYEQPVANAGTGGNNCGLEFYLNGALNVGKGIWTKLSGPGIAYFYPSVDTSNAKVTVTNYGIYSFRWTVTNGPCSNSADVTVNFVQHPPANAGTDGDACDMNFKLNPVITSGTGSWAKISGPGNAVFLPDKYKPDANVVVDENGTYDFAWTEVNAYCQTTDVVRVIFHDKPLLSAGKDTIICKGNSYQLQATGTGYFLWKPSSLLNNPNLKNPVASPEQTTTFLVTLTELQYGCKDSDEVTVGVWEKPVINAGPDKVLEYLYETIISADRLETHETGAWSVISGSGVFSYPDSTTTKVSGLSLGENILLWKVTNGVCDPVSDQVSVTVHDLLIPTLITPNMDGINDYLVLRGIETLGKTELTVFDRRGIMVFKNMNYDNLWNGVDYNENPLPDDTYFYVLKAKNGRSLSGYIVIRR